MAVKTIAYSYWRSMQRGARTLADVPAELVNDVKTIAESEVASGSLSAEQYETLIGEPFPVE